MRFKWLSIICTTLSLILLIYLFFSGNAQLSINAVSTLTLIEYLLGLLGFALAFYSKSSNKPFIILYSLLPVIITLCLFIFGYYLTAR
ncbi:hypothetical protein [Macrococcoides caseolyticum]|uniref:hypothetical protein n=1 Tax=Macrococcoides caseolyticum TaxID=69966 RepID=UPI001F43F601|nr:hypothetical protein [Macrococcus caseolyticus]MCE4956819.1 hypothetical protein [Macrococcus caseolyticus]